MSVVVECRYAPRGAARELFSMRERAICLSGAAGTGKTRACLEKLNAAAEKYAGMRGLIVRRHREHLTDAALVTFERDVLPEGHPARAGAARNQRREYRYPNGSVITVSGIYSHGAEQAQRIMSSEYDIVYVQEAIDLRLEEWEKLLSRLRSGVLPYQQIIADTNPSSPAHWLYQRALAGQINLMHTYHQDNPLLWDGQGWTLQGRAYLDTLETLTGLRRQRLLLGLWVQAEGMVYEIDPSVHIIDVPTEAERWFLSVDFGYRNPMVVQVWGLDSDNRLTLHHEWYRAGMLVEDVARAVRAWLDSRSIVPEAVICDHDAEGRATFERYTGLRTKPADKAVRRGIELCQARLRCDETGQPAMRFLRTARAEIDTVLRQRGEPTETIEELGYYQWSDQQTREEPMKQYDHGMDAMRYMVVYLDGGRQVNRWVY